MTLICQTDHLKTKFHTYNSRGLFMFIKRNVHAALHIKKLFVLYAIFIQYECILKISK